MTTVAYRNGIMASDSQSEWFYKELNVKKVFKHGDVLVGCSGQAGDALKFRDWILNKGDKPSVDEGFSAIVVKRGKVYNYDKTLTPLSSERYTAIGSGAAFAIAAMDCGKGAKDAVKIARRRDSGTGGRIQTVSRTKA